MYDTEGSEHHVKARQLLRQPVKATTNAGHTTNIDYSTSYSQGIF